MKSYFILFILVSSTLLCISHGNGIQDVFNQIYNVKTKTLTLDSSTLSDLHTTSFFTTIVSSESFKIKKPSCQIFKEASPPYLQCSGNMKIQSVDASLEFAIAYLGKNSEISLKLAGWINIHINGQWNPLESMQLQELSWMSKSLNYGQAQLTLTGVSSSLFKNPKSSSSIPHLQLIGEGVMMKEDSNILGLDSALYGSGPKASFSIDAFVPFQPETTKINKQKVVIKLSAVASVPFSPVAHHKDHGLVELRNVLLTIKDVSRVPDIDFDSTLVVLLETVDIENSNKRQLHFNVNGRWTTSSKELVLNGEAVGPWNIPFTRSKGWWTFEGAVASLHLSLATSPPTLDKFLFSGVSTLKIDQTTIQPALSGEISQNGKVFALELDISTQIMESNHVSLDQMIQTFGNIKGSPIVKSLEHSITSKTTLVLTNRESMVSSSGHKCHNGLNVFTSVHVIKDSKIDKLLAPLTRKSMESLEELQFLLTLQVQFFKPIQEKVEKVQLSLSTKLLKLSPFLQFQNMIFLLKLEDSSTHSVHTKGELQWKPKTTTDELLFQIDASWDSTSNTIQFLGGLKKEWKNPFGLKWLEISKAQLTFILNVNHQISMKDFQLQAKAKIAFAKHPNQLYSLFLHGENNFESVFFQTRIDINPNSGKTIGHQLLTSSSLSVSNIQLQDVATLNDLRFHKATLQLIFSTSPYKYNGKYYKSGITLESQVLVHQDRPLFKQLHALYQKKTSKDLVFTFHFHIPVEIPNRLTFRLRSPSLQVESNVILQGLQLDITIGQPIACKLSSSILAKFNAQPKPILFVVSGEISSVGQVSVAGGMKGLWKNAFGVPGFDLYKAYLALGFLPSPPYLGSFGLGANMTIGDAKIAVDGMIDITKPSDVFFKSKLKDLSFENIVKSFNQMRMEYAHERMLQSYEKIEIQSIPSFLHIYNLDLQFAPKDGILEIDSLQIVFKKGMTIYGDMSIFGLKRSQFHLQTLFDSQGPNFIVDINLNFMTIYEKWMQFMKLLFPNKEFQQEIEKMKFKHEINSKKLNDLIKKLSEILPQLTNLTIENLNFREMAKGNIQPLLSIEILYKKKVYSFSTKIGLKELNRPMIDIFNGKLINLKKLLNLPECLSNSDCPKGQKCYHNPKDKKDKTCQTSCNDLGEIPIFGCTKCLTSAECSKNGTNSCCLNGKCQKPRDGEYCGMCGFGRKCSSPHSGCILSFCTRCLTNLDCKWNGSAGGNCRNGQCV